MTTDYALFAPEELIFGTAANKSVVTNPNLLTEVAPNDFMIGSLQQGALIARIDGVGNFRDLGEFGIVKRVA